MGPQTISTSPLAVVQWSDVNAISKGVIKQSPVSQQDTDCVATAAVAFGLPEVPIPGPAQNGELSLQNI